MKKYSLFLMCACLTQLPVYSDGILWYCHFKNLFCLSVSNERTTEMVKCIEIPILKDRCFWFGNFVQNDFCILSETPDNYYCTVSSVNMRSGAESRQYEISKSVGGIIIIQAAFFTENFLYTLEKDRDNEMHVILKKRKRYVDEIISATHMAPLDFSPDFTVIGIFVAPEEKWIAVSLMRDRRTYQDRPYFVILSLDGELLLEKSGLFLHYAADENNIYYSDGNRLFSINGIENKTTEHEIEIDKKYGIAFLAPLGELYFIGLEKRQRNVLIDIFFGYGYITKGRYYLYSKTDGVFKKKSMLRSTLNESQIEQMVYFGN